MSELTKSYVDYQLALLDICPPERRELVLRNIGEATVTQLVEVNDVQKN